MPYVALHYNRSFSSVLPFLLQSNLPFHLKRSHNSQVATREKYTPKSQFVPAPPQQANYDHMHTRNEYCIVHIKLRRYMVFLKRESWNTKMNIQVIIVVSLFYHQTPFCCFLFATHAQMMTIPQCQWRTRRR